MNLAILSDNSKIVTMTSREIAELTGKDLSHIHRDTRVMLDELAGSNDPDLDHVREEKDARGYTTCFHLPKGLTITLMAGYSVKMRHAIVRRWQELEAKQATPVMALPQDYIQALESLLASKKSEQLALSQLAIAAPKADALDRIAGADGSMCITDAAKAINLQPKRLFAWMHANDWIYKRAGSSKWVAHQSRLKSAHLDCEYVTVLRADGTEKNIANVLVTAKGLAKLAAVAA